MEFNLHKLVHKVQENTINHPEWREGQILFNSLHELWPEIGNDIRATKLDPFYDDMKVPKLWEWLTTDILGGYMTTAGEAILDCSCGEPAETWNHEDWLLVGCKTCETATAARGDLKQAINDWNNIQKFVPKNLTTEGLPCKISIKKNEGITRI